VPRWARTATFKGSDRINAVQAKLNRDMMVFMKRNDEIKE